jgi:hypothetical protein
MLNSPRHNRRLGGEHGSAGAFSDAAAKQQAAVPTPESSPPQDSLIRSVGEIDFGIATPEYDAAIRAFLDTQAMEGPIRLRIRTEPSFFGAIAKMGERADVLVAQHCATREIVGVGVRLIRRLPVNSNPVRIGYLSFLRVAEQYRTPGVLRVGYRLLNDLQLRDPVPFSLTAILKENRSARNLLEANLRGLPIYTPLTEIHTYTLVTKSRALRPRVKERPLSARNSGAIVDQRSTRQIVIDGYSRGLQMLRPLYNAAKSIQGYAGFPPPGPLNLAYISQLKTDPSDPEDFVEMLASLASYAREKGIDYLAFALHADDPLAAVASRVAAHVTESILYAVRWPEDPPLPDFRGNLPQVEAAML